FAKYDYLVPKYGAQWYFFHRVDLHNELKRLATEPTCGAQAAKINLSSEVVDVDCEAGTLTLANGSTHQKDLIVAADGVHVSPSRACTRCRILTPAPSSP